MSLNYNRTGIDVNSIRGLFPKETSRWLYWIQQNKALYLNKEKVQKLITQQQTNFAEVSNLDLNSISNIINNFENAINIAEKNQKNYHITASASRLTRLCRMVKSVTPIQICLKTESTHLKLLNNGTTF